MEMEKYRKIVEGLNTVIKHRDESIYHLTEENSEAHNDNRNLWIKINNFNIELERVNEEYRREMEKYRKIVEELNQEIDRITNAYNKKSKQLDESHNITHAWINKYLSKEYEIEELKQKIELLNQKYKSEKEVLKKQLQSFKNENKNYKLKVNQSNEMLECALKSTQDSKLKNSNLWIKINNFTNNLDKEVKEVERLNKVVKELEFNIKQKQNEITDLETLKGNVDQGKKNVEMENEKLHKQFVIKQKKIEELKKSLSIEKHRNSMNEKSKSQLVRSIRDRSINLSTDRDNKWQSMLQKLNDKYEELKRKYQDLLYEKNDLRLKLKKFEDLNK
jgi:chromosome segregation protein